MRVTKIPTGDFERSVGRMSGKALTKRGRGAARRIAHDTILAFPTRR